jgi:hypothetical protein
MSGPGQSIEKDRKMSPMRCARCNYYAFDYCERCGEPLCDTDMKAGCCGDTPARSGVEQDYADNHGSEAA